MRIPRWSKYKPELIARVRDLYEANTPRKVVAVKVGLTEPALANLLMRHGIRYKLSKKSGKVNLYVRIHKTTADKARRIAHLRGTTLSGYVRTLIERDAELEGM